MTALVEGRLVRGVILPLSEERGQGFVKLAKTKSHGGEVMVKYIGNAPMDNILKSGLDEVVQGR